MESRKIKCFVLCLACIAISVVGKSEDVGDCILRFEDTRACACSNYSKIPEVSCEVSDIRLGPCYCMHYDSDKNITLMAECYYFCYIPHRIHIQTINSTSFNADFCGQYDFHRAGLFCGECAENYGLAVYSYQTVNCVPCEDYGYKNWLKYFAVALLPLTVFYILAVLFSFNVTSSSFSGLLVIAQCMISPQQVEYLAIVDLNKKLTPLNIGSYIVIKIFITIFSMTNLDFFRLLYSPFCLHPKATIVEILSLNYIITVYPFLLIFLTYVLVNAYDQEYRLLLFVWKPFKWCLYRYRQTWNIRATLIQVFATFTLFAYVKILGVSLEILYLSISQTSITNVAGERAWNGFYTIYNVEIEYFSARHLPFAVIATATSLLFVLLPLFFLAFYPCKCFQRCLNLCGGRCQPLHVVMDVFQGHYRTHPRDLRSFSAFYMLLRILLLLQWYTVFTGAMQYTSGILSLSAAAVYAIFKPYKVGVHNTIDTVLMLLMGIYFFSLRENANYYSRAPITYPKLFEGLSISLILIYSILLLSWKLQLHLKVKSLVKILKRVCKPFRVANNNNRGEDEVVESFQRNYNAIDHSDSSPLLSVESELPTY